MTFIKILLVIFLFSNFIILNAQSKKYSKHFECPRIKTVMPVKYSEHRFIVEPITATGKKLSFYTDTGGGLFIHKSSAEKTGLIQPNRTEKKPIDFPTFQKDSAIPKPIGSNGKIYVLKKNPKGNHFINQQDGMLGQAWFADRTWVFDYPNQKLILKNINCKKIKANSKHAVKIGFKTNDKGERIASFPRIQVEIDGEVLDLLFDTGATTTLTEDAVNKIKDGRNASRATSFITNSVFEKWRKDNPSWRVIENAESKTNEAMIEVPKMKIAEFEVGPVWFTRRADKNFHEFMSKFMDKKVEGAIGGSGLYFFKITVDYPNAIALFEKD